MPGLTAKVFRTYNASYTMSYLLQELKIDQSVAHDGVCLTVVAVDAAAGTHVVTAIDETLRVTNLGQWQPGRLLNRQTSTLGVFGESAGQKAFVGIE